MLKNVNNMGIFKVVIGRNKNYSKNQEFEVQCLDDFNDGITRLYSQEPYKKMESDIIKDIESGEIYKTKNDNNTYTLCEVGTNNGVKYLTSVPNNTTKDNITSLPKY